MRSHRSQAYLCRFKAERILSVSLYLDSEDSSGSEVRLSCWEHLETGRLLSAQSAFYWTPCCPATSILWKIWQDVAGAGERLWGLPVYQKVSNLSWYINVNGDFRSILTPSPLYPTAHLQIICPYKRFQRNEAVDVEVMSSDCRSTQTNLKQT